MANTDIKVIVVGCGNMGGSHARAYHRLEGFELVGLVDSNAQARADLARELGNIEQYDSFLQAMDKAKPDAVAICTWPDTHAQLAEAALQAGAHVFVEKPMAPTVQKAQHLVELAESRGKKLVTGHILRHHPAWSQFVQMARTLGKPLVMRMNLNQQSKGPMWQTHKHLMETMSPIVDCGVHYVDVMCQMTRANPIRVQAIGARLTDEIAEDMYNYGQLQVAFDDGSVGWYEAGWGPMMSEQAFFVKDVAGPAGSVSIVASQAAKQGSSDDINAHTQTNCLLRHHAELTADQTFAKEDQYIDTTDEPDHQQLCDREQAFFLDCIKQDKDLSQYHRQIINSLRIVLAADRSVKTGKAVELTAQTGL